MKRKENHDSQSTADSASLPVTPGAVSNFDTWSLSMDGSHTILQGVASLVPADNLDDDKTTSQGSRTIE